MFITSSGVMSLSTSGAVRSMTACSFIQAFNSGEIFRLLMNSSRSARGKLVRGLFQDVGVTFCQNIKSELAHRLGAGAAWRDARGQVQRTGGALSKTRLA